MLGPYTLQAAIAACHARAWTADQTDWGRIVALYDALAQLTPSPVVELNRAVAVSMAYGPEAALELVDALVAEHALSDYHLLPSVRGDLLARLGRVDEARAELERAAALTQNESERRLLSRRARRALGARGFAARRSPPTATGGREQPHEVGCRLGVAPHPEPHPSRDRALDRTPVPEDGRERRRCRSRSSRPASQPAGA